MASARIRPTISLARRPSAITLALGLALIVGGAGAWSIDALLAR